MPDNCPGCIQFKTEANTYCKCERCGWFRPLKPAELQKVSKRAPKNG